MLTFKDFLIAEGTYSGNNSLTSDSYNWKKSPQNWTDLTSSNKIQQKELPSGIKPMSARRLWGKVNPKPSEEFVNKPPHNSKFTVRIKDKMYFVWYMEDGISVKEVVSDIKAPTDPTRSANPSGWKDVSRTEKTPDNFDKMVRLSADGLWKQGMGANPNTPFDGSKVKDGWPTDFNGNVHKAFRTTIKNNHYLVRLGKTPADRTVTQLV